MTYSNNSLPMAQVQEYKRRLAINNGGPAFPTVAGQTVYSNGMTLRDWFAGQALAGACAKWCSNAHADMDPDALVAKWAYEIADAMIAARND